ncbi:hypothetical protein BGZ98_005627 [Dissophora globulifera]|nr:hypothetical protein BGZ98_005627 [Dissophora globulifera]
MSSEITTNTSAANSTRLACEECAIEFSTEAQLKHHTLESHSPTTRVAITTPQGGKEKVVLKRVDGHFKCPRCSKLLGTKSGIRKHLERLDCGQSAKDTEEALEPVTVLGTVSLPSLPVATSMSPSLERNFDDTVLAACHQVHQDDRRETEKTLYIVECLGLSPIILQDYLGIEQCALAHNTIVKRLSLGQAHVTAVLPATKKRKLDSDLCRRCSPITPSGMDSLMAVSPLAAVLRTRQFVELDESYCDMLNEDWTFRPQLRYACAQLLAGAVLLNTNNGHAIMANCVEAYGRTKQLDAHREHFVTRKGTAAATSLPPSTGSRYPDVWPLSIFAADGPRLVIGTQSFNGLITSSMRLDCVDAPSIGGSTTAFQLLSPQESQATRIFLDLASIKSALALAADENARGVSPRNTLGQLRQLRSQFHLSSTFMLCRASGHLTRSHTCQPYSVFTMANYDQSHEGNAQAAAVIFHEIARDVLKRGAEGSLKRSAVESARLQCTDKGTVVLDNILALFGPEATSVPVLGNKLLNKELEDLAEQLSGPIANANKTVASFVQQGFSPSQPVNSA